MLKIFWLVTALFFVMALNYSLSVRLMPGYSLYDIKRILELILLLWGGFYLLFAASKRRMWLNLYRQLPYTARLLILCVFAIGLFSTLFAPLTKMALLEVALFFLLFAYSLFIASQRIVYGVIIDKALLTIIALGLAVYESVFFYTFISAVISRHIFNPHPGFINPRFLAQYLVWTLPLVSLPLGFTDNKKNLLKIIIYIIAVSWWTIAFANIAKGMLLSLLISGIAVFLIFKKEAKTWLTAQIRIIGISIVMVAIGVNSSHISAITSNIAGSITARILLWKQAIGLMITHPIFGVGPMHYSYYINHIAAHPHNSLLLIGSEWGIPALFLVLALFAWGLSAWIRQCKTKALADTAIPAIPIALTSSFIAGSCYSLVSGVLITPLSQITMCLILGWMSGIYYTSKTMRAKNTLTTEIIFMLFLVFGIAGIVTGIVPDIFNLFGKELNWLLIHSQKHQELIFNPRFWLQGWLR